MVNNHKIVSIAKIERNPQFVLHELVKLVHINVRKKLAGQVADRQTPGKAANNDVEKPNRFFVFYPFFQDVNQNIVIYRLKEFLNIALKRKARPGIIPARSAQNSSQACHAPMRPLAQTAGVRIINKAPFKYGIQDGENGVVHEAVPNQSLMDMPLFRVVNVETMIRPVPVSAASEFTPELKNVFLQIVFKNRHILFAPFSFPEFCPGREQIFRRRDF